MALKRTKIICTIGPASTSQAILQSMIQSGMNAARLNFSHGDYAGHKKLIRAVGDVSKKMHEPVTLIADIQGPKIRLGVLPDQGLRLKKGSTVTFSGLGGGGSLAVTYPEIHRDVRPGEHLLIDDGLLELEVTKVVGKIVTANVLTGGLVTSHKGMNFPDTRLRIRPMTDKDKADVVFAVQQGVHWVAMSFVRQATDVGLLRTVIRKALKNGQREPKVLAKIETPEALKNIDAILKAADGIIIARGDLGVETPPEDVPLHQKVIIQKCRAAGKPVVVATQMLDSMIRHPRPTRAEVSDVANAVIDHTEAVMLSGETASGKYPVEAVTMMQKICRDTEESVFDDLKMEFFEHQKSSKKLLSTSLGILSHLRKIDAVIAATALAEETLSELNGLRPEVPIYLACVDDDEAREWNIRWGIVPFVLNKKGNAIAQLKAGKQLKRGQNVALVVHRGGKPQIEIVKV